MISSCGVAAFVWLEPSTVISRAFCISQSSCSIKRPLGVMQYDFGKVIQGHGFQNTRFLNQPPATLRTAITGRQALYKRKGNRQVETSQSLYGRCGLNKGCQSIIILGINYRDLSLSKASKSALGQSLQQTTEESDQISYFFDLILAPLSSSNTLTVASILKRVYNTTFRNTKQNYSI